LEASLDGEDVSWDDARIDVILHASLIVDNAFAIFHFATTKSRVSKASRSRQVHVSIIVLVCTSKPFKQIGKSGDEMKL
jgi:hypothetical protein